MNNSNDKEEIKLSKEDKENIVEGLSQLVDFYANNLRELIEPARLHGDILECELVGIDDQINRLKSAVNTLDLFRKKWRESDNEWFK